MLRLQRLADTLQPGCQTGQMCYVPSRSLCRYPWGQEPLAYIAAWRLVHSVLANMTCRSVLIASQHQQPLLSAWSRMGSSERADAVAVHP